MKAKIGIRLLQALHPTIKPFEVVDNDLPGFLLRVQPSGVMTYYARYRMANGRQNRVKLGRKEHLTPVQARDEAKKVLADATTGIDPAEAKRSARRDTLAVFLTERYGPWVIPNRKSGAKTLQRLQSRFSGLLANRLDEIDSWTIEKWRSERAKAGAAAPTTNRDIATLRAALSKAVEWGQINVHPLKNFRLAKEDRNRKVRYLERNEERCLMKALDAREERLRSERDSANVWRMERGYELLPNLRQTPFADHLKPMVLLSLNTGLRRGEMFNLEWTDIIFNRALLTVRGEGAKSGVTRHIPLNRVAIEVLLDWQSQTGDQGLVFKSPVTGGRFDNVHKGWKEVTRQAKIDDFRWHDLRHDFASKLTMAGVDLYRVQRLLGHSTPVMTQRYAHLGPEHLADAVAALDQCQIMVDVVTSQTKEE